MIIVLEGMDNSGKTTLGHQLADDLQLTEVHACRKPQVAQDIADYQEWLEGSPNHVVVDRHPAFSDLVYGPILRGRTPANWIMAQNIRKHVFLVYCRPPDTQILNFKDRHQMSGVREKGPFLIKGYDGLMESLKPDFRYDFSQPKQLENLLDYLKPRIH